MTIRAIVMIACLIVALGTCSFGMYHALVPVVSDVVNRKKKGTRK